MLKRELKVNFKNFIIWLSILIAIFLLVYVMYPFIITDVTNQMDEMLAMFPEEMLKAFNMDISSIDTAFGWIKTEGWTFVILITAVYSALLGSNILLKEESDKTIEYLGFLPVKRTKIVLSKVLCGIIYIILLIVLFAIFNFISLSISGEFDKDVMLYLSLTPLFTSLVMYSLCLFISTFFRKTKKMIGISLAVVFISYFLNIASTISKDAEVLKYLSIFTLADVRNVIVNVTINPVIILLSFSLTVLFIILTIIRYNKKEFV